MDKSAAQTLLAELLREHPDLRDQIAQPPRLSPAEKKPVATTIRTTQSIMDRIGELVQKLDGTPHIDYRGKLSQSDVIRAALEKGVRELERLA